MTTAYDYEGRVALRGDPAAALELVRERLTEIRFKVSPAAADQLQFVNMFPYPNVRQHPLQLVSRGCVTAAESSLILQADMGYLREPTKYVFISLAVIAVPVTAVMFIVCLLVAKQPALLGVFAPLLVAPVPLLLLVLKIRMRRVSRALDALLAEAAGTAARR